jgi:hypothetical protein
VACEESGLASDSWIVSILDPHKSLPYSATCRHKGAEAQPATITAGKRDRGTKAQSRKTIESQNKYGFGGETMTPEEMREKAIQMMLKRFH